MWRVGILFYYEKVQVELYWFSVKMFMQVDYLISVWKIEGGTHVMYDAGWVVFYFVIEICSGVILEFPIMNYAIIIGSELWKFARELMRVIKCKWDWF